MLKLIFTAALITGSLSSFAGESLCEGSFTLTTGSADACMNPLNVVILQDAQVKELVGSSTRGKITLGSTHPFEEYSDYFGANMIFNGYIKKGSALAETTFVKGTRQITERITTRCTRDGLTFRIENSGVSTVRCAYKRL